MRREKDKKQPGRLKWLTFSLARATSNNILLTVTWKLIQKATNDFCTEASNVHATEIAEDLSDIIFTAFIHIASQKARAFCYESNRVKRFAKEISSYYYYYFQYSIWRKVFFATLFS
jgi:hypothetical protein